MRLSEFQVKFLCQKVLLGLKTKKLINFKKPEMDVLVKMQEIFIKDLKVEDAINQEAERILAQYEAQMGDKIDRQKMFQMIKKQLIKDKGVII